MTKSQETYEKLLAYGRSSGGFTVMPPSRANWQVIDIHPVGGTWLRLTQGEAEIFLSGYVTGLRIGQR